ncbi:hypothetical protein AND4_05874 [Vibrio sp. AND4]|nr:hypothetical protein AND4_05874 [Vibrio sp. AND4]
MIEVLVSVDRESEVVAVIITTSWQAVTMDAA